jgi:adenylosuccinate lyase
MIDRYSLPAMKDIWSEESKLSNWLRIEVLACEAMVELGHVPREALDEIQAKAAFDAERVREIEKRTRHDVVAFLENLAENIGPSARFLHLGMTSSDVLDTGLALQLRQAVDILIEDASRLLGMIKGKALIHRDTVMIGRTHGVHAEPITFGQKLAVWAFEMRRDLDRLLRAKEIVSYGKISGAVGSYASLDPFVERYVCERLGLKPAEASTQVLQRDRHAEFMSALAITAATLEKFATEVRALQKTEVMEAEEPFREGQTGSSAMPHKRNPIICERVCGLARVVRGNMLVALENVALWHERDISHSSAERVILPDSTLALDYMMNKFTEVMDGLVVYPEKMERDIQLTGGLIFSEKVLLALVAKGVTRQDAYRMVQRNAMASVRGEKAFREGLLDDQDVRGLLSADEVDACFDVRASLGRLDNIFERLENLKVEP